MAIEREKHKKTTGGFEKTTYYDIMKKIPVELRRVKWHI